MHAIVDELRARAPRRVTRHQLAEWLEVSSRTIERDVRTLQLAGVPIWSDPGRIGGYSIIRTTSMPPLNLTPEEAVAVVVALATSSGVPFHGAGQRAKAKLLSGMRESDAEAARDLAERLRIDAATAVDQPKALRDQFEVAAAQRRVVELSYRDRKRRRSQRMVEAHGLYLTGGHWYLIGWCRTRQAGRAFRLDRVQSLRVTDEQAPERPVDELSIWATQGQPIDI